MYFTTTAVSFIVLQGSFILAVDMNTSLFCLSSFIGSLLNTFNFAVITFKAHHGFAPDYISELIKPYTP